MGRGEFEGGNMKIIVLCIILLTLASIINMVVVLHTQSTLSSRVERIESNYQHLLHRMNAIEYPEVLGKEGKKASNSDG